MSFEEKVATDDKVRLELEVVRDAAAADAKEHSMTLKEGWRTHRKAILWSMALSGALIMEGYDVVVIGAFYGHPAFLKRFGVPANTEIGYAIPAEWQSALSNGSSAGGILGLLVNGWAADRFGPKIVMQISIIALTAFIFIFVFAKSLTMLVIAEVFCGIPWGVFQTLTTAYASEVCPIQLRGYLASYVSLCWGAGILISSGVVKATTAIEGDWSWRLPFVLQWVWVIPLFIIVWFCPTSPWWLVRHNRIEEAQHAVRRLTSPEYVSEQDVNNTVAMMVHTNEMERQIQEGTTYIQCFQGTDRRRTEVSMMVFAMQLLSGQNLVGQATQFLQRAGIGTDLSFTLNMIVSAMFVIGTMSSWVWMAIGLGRRTIYFVGMVCMCATLFLVGGLGWVSEDSSSYIPTGKAIASLLIILSWVYNASIGPICYTIIAEVSSTRLRGKTIVLSRIAYQIINITCGIVVPRMLSGKDTGGWGLGAKSGVVWGVSALFCCIYTWLRLPETGKRSYGELDILFEQGVPAWKFKKTKVDQFHVSEVNEKITASHVEHA